MINGYFILAKITGSKIEKNKVLNFIRDILQETPQPVGSYYLLNKNSYNILFQNFPYNIEGCFEGVDFRKN